MKERDSLLLDELVSNLLKLMEFQQAQPYKPHWGELFVILHDIQRVLKYAEEDIVLYPIHPTGELIYDHKKKLFVAKTPNFNVNMDADKFIDALMSNRLRPCRTIHEETAPTPGVSHRIWRRPEA